MNDYGYLIYEDYPVNTNATASVNYQVQAQSGSIPNNVKTDYVEYATFERSGLDFGKFLYFYDAQEVEKEEIKTINHRNSVRISFDGLQNVDVYYHFPDAEYLDIRDKTSIFRIVNETANYLEVSPKYDFGVYQLFFKIVGKTPPENIISTSVDISNEDGEFQAAHALTITPALAVSGSGITLQTQIPDYTITITVTDSEGVRTRTFEKSADEFYPIIFDGLQSIEIEFTRITPYSFIKIGGFALGKVRIFDESKINGTMSIGTHYSVTGKELEYDTLDFSLNPDDELFLLEGQKITYSRTGRVFYIAEAKKAPDGIIDVACYDDISRLDNTFYGIYSEAENLETRLSDVLKGGYTDITVEFKDFYSSVRTITGVIPIVTNREAARLLLLGTGLRLRRKANSVFELSRVDSTEYNQPTGIFNEDTIIGMPSVQENPHYSKISFLKHYYKTHTENGREEVFNGVVAKNSEQTVTWNDPHKSITFWRVTGQDAEGNDEYAGIDNPSFRVVSTGNYSATIVNVYNERISAWGYPVKESHYRLNYDVPNVPVRYKDTVNDITEVTDLFDVDNTALGTYLNYISKFNTKVAFSSVMEANEGDYVEINYNDESYKGWITYKKDEARGLYYYEVECE